MDLLAPRRGLRGGKNRNHLENRRRITVVFRTYLKTLKYPLPRQRIQSNLINISLSPEAEPLNIQPVTYTQLTQRNYYVPKLMLANVMSLVPKLDEVQEFILRNKICLAFITETWLKESISESVVSIPGFTIIRRDRIANNHGGVCVYIKDGNTKYRLSEELACCQDHEVLWLQLRPDRLPRGFSCLIVAAVYHPPGADENLIRDHLFQSLALAESKFPNCGIIVAGDFNRLDVKRIKKHFRLKQVVKSPTRNDVILDFVLTNMHDYYNTPQILPPFGLSDHNTVMVLPKARASNSNTRNVISKRDSRASCKRAMGRFLSSMDWPLLLNSLESCEDSSKVFQDVIHIGLDFLMPVRKIRVIPADPIWMSQKLKSLILKRQEAFSKNGADSVLFRFYRNAVNRERKTCKANYYKLRVQQMKGENPKAWWREVKRISGMQSRSGNLLSQINVEEIKDLPDQEIANVINKAFLGPLEEYRLPSSITPLQLEEDNPELLEVSEERVLKLLSKLNPAKASGPDEIPNWLLREYAEWLAYPVKTIPNASFSEQRLPSIWKCADVTPLPKKQPVQCLKKDLRPISLTPCISKVAEDIVVCDYVKPAAMKIIDPNQYGTVPKSSTTFALLSMIHEWTKGTDGNGSTVRALFFDYRKAFDLIDHNILVHKLRTLDVPISITNWIIDFLSNRLQRIKLAEGCLSEWGSVPSGVPQGTKLGPWLFIIMINDLVIRDARVWKYVDDTTISEVVRKNDVSSAQLFTDNVVQWSLDNRVQLNTNKCKELRISFARNQQELEPIKVMDKDLEIVDSVKLLGLTITSNLSWNLHVNEVIKKASKRLYFLVQLKRANVPRKDLGLFYITCIRSLLDYAVPVFHFSIPQYLMCELERIQKRALSIICYNHDYTETLKCMNIVPLADHHKDICNTLFTTIVNDKNHRLHQLLPPSYETKHNLRHSRSFNVPRWKTNRFKNTYIMSSCLNANMK